MTTKDIAKNIIDSLPDAVDMDEIIYALYIRLKFDQGLRKIDGGKGIDHDKAKEIIRSWVITSA